MSSSSVRAFPLAAALAIVGGAAGLIALALPWFAFDPDGLMQLAKALGLDTVIAKQSGMSPDQLQETMAAQLQGMNSIGSGELVGYKVFSPISVAVQAIAAAGALYAALRMLSGELPGTLTGPLFAGAFVVGGRAIYGILQVPGNDELQTLGLTTDLVTPAIGLWVALGGGVLLLLAALAATMQGSATTSSEWIAQSGAVPGNAHVPSSMTTGDGNSAPSYAASATPSYGAPAGGVPSYGPPPVQAYAPPPAPAAPAYPPPAQAYTPPPAQAYVPPAQASPGAGQTYAGAYVPPPASYQPGMAYGDEGPSSLDSAKNAPRAADPYAPKRAGTPEAPMPQAAPVAPLRAAPLDAPQAPGPPRGSVAPPGLS